MRGVWTGVLALAALLTALVAVPATAGADTRSQTLRQLDLQYELAGDVPLRNAPWVFTHNSYNSPAEMGLALSPQDRNQNITVVDQLDEGVRSLELDVHLFVGRPVLCHSTGPHLGCTTEKTFREVLREIRGWIDRNPRQVLLLYLEGHLDTDAGYGLGSDDLEAVMGGLIYRPPSGGARCDPLPLEATRNQVRASGKRLLLMGDCGEGSRWQSYVHDDRQRLTASTNAPFRDFPDCGPDYTRAQYESRQVRYYEDATTVGASTGSEHGTISPPLVGRMTRCGVDLIGFDLLKGGDPRVAAQVWSWAANEPTRGRDCAIQGAGGRWFTRPCGERHRVACRDATGLWRIARKATARGAARACGRPALVQGVPRTGYEGQRLLAAQKRAGAGAVWLGIRRRGDGWKAYERKGCRRGASARRCPD